MNDKWYFNPVYWLGIIMISAIVWFIPTQEPVKHPTTYGWTMGLTIFNLDLHKLEEQLQKMEGGDSYMPSSMKLIEGQKVEIIHRYSNGGLGNYFDDLYKVKIGGTEIYLWSLDFYTVNANNDRIKYIEM